MDKQSSLKMNSKRVPVSLMDYKLLETATNNFSKSDILGKGGFGCVYKAQLEENLHAAVKRLIDGSVSAITEFEVPFSLKIHSWIHFLFPRVL